MTRFTSERGTTLIETAMACSLLLIVCIGLAGMSSMASQITENQGHLAARTAEYAVDKMEQLLQLTYGDAQSDTTKFPSVTAGGTGLAVGGSSDPAAAVTGYTDYLDADGNPLCNAVACTATPPDTWFYMRVWKVSTTALANLKKIEVTSTIRSSLGKAVKSQSTVAAYKTNCPSGC